MGIQDKIESRWQFKSIKSTFAKRFSQVEGVHFSEIFSLVIKPGIIHLILIIVIIRGCAIRQMDVKNAFLNGVL